MTPSPPEQAGMRLRVLTPLGIVIDDVVAKIVAEAPNGSFGLLPRHIDFASELKPGIVVYQTPGGLEQFLGINEGTLVKCGNLVLISTRDVVRGDDLDKLETEIENTFRRVDEHERAARTALARLEAGMIRNFLKVEKAGT
jgi:F-type H+-transporting ATPase subunit epsilon